MALLRMKLDGEKYEVDLDKISLGEGRLLKREFGMDDFSDLNFFDPDQLVGLFVVAVMRAHPDMPYPDVLKKVEGIESGPIFDDINNQVAAAVEKARAEQADPPRAAGSASTPAAVRGSSARPRKTRGTPSSRKP